MLNNFDSYLIDKRFQPPAHRWQKLTGLTNFWLAKWAYIFAGLSVILLCVVVVNTIGLLNVFSLLVYFFSFIVVVLFICDISYLEKEDKEFVENFRHVANNRRIQGKRNRVFGLCLFIFFFTLFVFGILLINSFVAKMLIFIYFTAQMFLLFGLYFSDCTPLPPGKSKIKKWYEKVLIKINEKLAEKPVSLPVKS